MSTSPAQPRSLVPPAWQLLPAAAATAAVVVAAVALQQQHLPLSLPAFTGLLVITTLAAAMLFGPSRMILTAVFLMALLDHQFRSVAILPIAGVEWHPRELLLLLLAAHGAVKLWQHRLHYHWTPVHFGLMLYTAVFAWMAWRGLWLGNAPRDIIAECRAPLFLGAFWVFAGAVRDPRDLQYYGNIAFCVLVLLASISLAAFAYFALAGPVPNVQNALGEFVPRMVGSVPAQSIRPSGHAWFETALVITLGMLLCPREPWFRKALYLVLIPLFALATGVELMRTAWVSVGVSVAILAWLSLPRIGRGLCLALALGLAAAGALLVLLYAPDAVRDAVAGDRSLAARNVETWGALEAFAVHPFFGAGLGASFTALGLAAEDSAASAIPVSYHSLHNVWLYFLWKGGLVGLALVISALGGMLLYSHRIVNRLPSMNQRCLGRALQAALIGQLVASAAMPRLTYANGALFLVLWAMAFVLLDRISRGHATAISR